MAQMPTTISRPSSLSGTPTRAQNSSGFSDKYARFRRYDDTGTIEYPGLPGDKDDDGSVEDPFNTAILPSTPAHLSLRARPVTPWSTQSAPAVFQRSPMGDPSGTSNSREKVDVDERIEQELKKQLLSTDMNKKKTGHNYLFEIKPANDPQRTIVKIGRTGSTEQVRLNEIKNTCRHVEIQRKVDPEGGPIQLSQKAEALILAELHDFMYSFVCSCQRSHREYFKVDAATAQEVVQRWRAFCESEPYDTDGGLLPFWKHRLREHMKRVRREQGSTPAASGEHERRRIRWKRFATPTKFDILFFHVTYTAPEFQRWRWHLIALFQALALTFVFWSSLSFAWLCLLLMGVFYEMFKHYRSTSE
ncbi:hypothetical protein F4802DRAFT_550276 [Xylaria palmicola]|nr:hypothetical protein F4802DRAFT_550276 [Xylaria palmicola]